LPQARCRRRCSRGAAAQDPPTALISTPLPPRNLPARTTAARPPAALAYATNRQHASNSAASPHASRSAARYGSATHPLRLPSRPYHRQATLPAYCGRRRPPRRLLRLLPPDCSLSPRRRLIPGRRRLSPRWRMLSRHSGHSSNGGGWSEPCRRAPAARAWWRALCRLGSSQAIRSANSAPSRRCDRRWRWWAWVGRWRWWAWVGVCCPAPCHCSLPHPPTRAWDTGGAWRTGAWDTAACRAARRGGHCGLCPRLRACARAGRAC